jgi:hypothetical protein
LHERAGGFGGDEHLVAHLQVLQTRGERAIGYLDRVELEVFLPVGAGDRISTQQRFAIDHQADHHELAVDEAKTRIAGAAEAEEGVGPVMHPDHFLDAKVLGQGR